MFVVPTIANGPEEALPSSMVRRQCTRKRSERKCANPMANAELSWVFLCSDDPGRANADETKCTQKREIASSRRGALPPRALRLQPH
ncbi:hypothetical protein AB1Y20_003758 [Prymnesium parvum]|uniref:Uncharacterized protein n=1 Tax=Prymnesium parvum TaxID=97485 RepID=A0AB34J7G4_PRYPA|mmetsp:Transcript_8473/g.20313  ORF Transcript_8473/g.20313 Transcript_8473/m.20313 type:complete len:87 (+) Transcript_8473:130-390(+)